MKKKAVAIFLSWIILPAIGFSQLKTDANKNSTKVSWLAHILRQTESPQISDLIFFSKSVPVVLIPTENELRPLVEIKYKFVRQGWRIQVQGSAGKLSNSEEQIYSLFAMLNSQISEVEFSAVGPEGQKETETIYLFAPEAQEFQVLSSWNSLVGYFGFANLSYEQSGIGVLSAKTILLGVSYMSVDSSSRFGLLGGGKLTVATFESQPIATNPQLIQAHADISMRISWDEMSRWRHKIFVGGNYLALVSNGSPFGFAALIAPEIGWLSQYYRNPRASFLIDFKTVLLKNSSLDSQRGLHLQLTLSETLKSARKQDWSLHFSTTNYESAGQRIAPHLVGLSLGYSF